MVALSWLSSPGGGKGGQSGSTSIGAVGNWACGGDVVSRGGVGDCGGDTTICGVSARLTAYAVNDDVEIVVEMPGDGIGQVSVLGTG